MITHQQVTEIINAMERTSAPISLLDPNTIIVRMPAGDWAILLEAAKHARFSYYGTSLVLDDEEEE